MIIITGGAGFIGSCLIAELNKQNRRDILVVDNLSNSSKWENIANKKIEGYLHKSKFREIIAADNKHEKIKKIHAIVHLGACSTTTEKDVDYLMDNNFLYSKELAEFAIKNEIRFIYASSAATYGNGEKGYSDASIDGLLPLNPYGFSKHLFDMWLTENNLLSQVTGLKFFNVFGPNEYHKGNMRSMFLKAFEQIRDTGKVLLFKSQNPKYADGEQKRDFVYVKDCCKIIASLITNYSVTGIYNIGSGTARSWNDVAKAVFAAMKIKPNIEYIGMPPEIALQYQYFTQAETSKIESKLQNNWKWTTIEDAATDYIKNYLQENKIL